MKGRNELDLNRAPEDETIAGEARRTRPRQEKKGDDGLGRAIVQCVRASLGEWGIRTVNYLSRKGPLARDPVWRISDASECRVPVR